MIFKVAALTEREERVARAAAGMNAADGGEHAGCIVDEFDAFIEIVAAENDVIEQSGTSSSSSALAAQVPHGNASAPAVKARSSCEKSSFTPRDFRCGIANQSRLL